MSTPQAPKGTYDLLPDESAERDEIVAAAARVFAAYGYRHIVTPEFEDTALFERGVGEATDIVRKEMYTFPDKGGRLLTLRPEGTAPVCRAYIEHGMHKWPQPVKLWYHAPMFRYERPQAGRYREHYQIGAESIGTADPAVDAEVVALLGQILGELGLDQVRLVINSMGDKTCRPAYGELLRGYLRAHEDELCPDCRVRIELNPLRTFDCKEEGCRAVTAHAPRLIDHLCAACREHFERVLGLLRVVGLEPDVDTSLVRGLDYYTRTTFEFQSLALESAQNAVGGGGRYDGLVKALGGPDIPGVGFALGVERLILSMADHAGAAPVLPEVFIAPLGAAAETEAMHLAHRWRRDGVRVEMTSGGKSLKSQMRLADKMSVQYVLILGDDELAGQALTVRDMAAKRDFARAVELSSSGTALREALAQLTHHAVEQRA